MRNAYPLYFLIAMSISVYLDKQYAEVAYAAKDTRPQF